jgi:hypothetical protein
VGVTGGIAGIDHLGGVSELRAVGHAKQLPLLDHKLILLI